MTLRTVVSCVLFSFASVTPSLAQASIKHPIDISQQQLGSALAELARQTHIQVVYSTDLVEGRRTAGLSGTMTPEEALEQLLSKTGLRYEFLDAQTVTLSREGGSGTPPATPAAAPRSRASVGTPEHSFWERFRLAQAAPAVPAVGTSSERTREEPEQGRLEEIVVTAQKREERVFDVPISIVAMGSEELERRNVTNIDDLSMAVPGLYAQSNGSYARTITLRGIGNQFGNSSLIGLYLDEASVTSFPSYVQPDLRTYDLERVEVLRGPQGTLYGEGSVGGTIRFITAKPQLDRFRMNANVAALFTEDGALSQRLEGVLNVPLATDKLGIRIAGTFDHQGGWVDQPAANREDFNEQNLADVRVKALWRPTAAFAANVMAVIHRNDVPPNIGEDDDGNFTQVFGQTTTPAGKDDYDLYNATLTYDFASAQLLSSSSYMQQEREVRNLARRFAFSPPGDLQSHAYYPLYTPGDSSSFTQELRLTSIGEGRLQWTVGGFYRDVDSSITGSYNYGQEDSPGLPTLYSFAYRYVSQSWAVFGDASFQVTDRLTFGAGLRHFSDDQEAASDFSSPPVLGPAQSGSFDATNPRVYAKYRVTDQANVYLSAAKGFRSGGFNGTGQPTYDPESVWTYELGTKVSWLDGRLSSEAALYYTDYTDYQIIGIVQLPSGQPVNLTSNAGSATIKGVEWGFTWYPTDDWSLSFNGNYVDSEFDKINAVNSSHAVGDPLDLSAKYGYALSAQRDFQWNGKEAFARLDYNVHDRMFYRNRYINGPTAGPTPWFLGESGVIQMLNFKATLQWSEQLSLGVFAQNLLNDRDFTDPLNIDASAGRSRPRSFGVEFSVAFD